MGKEVKGRLNREGTYVHVDVWQKPAQFCKAVILQLENKFKIKKKRKKMFLKEKLL